jgi:ferredoxin
VKIEIDQEKCIGCGFCKERLPSIFFLDGYTARLTELGKNIDNSNEILIRQIEIAAKTCPSETITVDEEILKKTAT